VNARYFLQLIALSALWGASFPMLRVVSPQMGAGMTALMRMGIATIALAIIMRAVGQRWPWHHWRELTLLGLLSVAGPFLLFSWASLHLPAAYLALLNPTAVVFATLTSAWFKEDTLTLNKLLGCVCGFAGLTLILRLGPLEATANVLLGTGATLLGTLCFGLSAPLMKRATRRMDPLAITGPMHAAGALFLLPFGLWGLPQARFTPEGLLIVTILGVITSGLAFWMHLRILRHVTPVASMSPIFLVPMFGVTWAHLFLDEPLSPGIFTGGALVLLAAALVTGINPLRRTPRP
jgi:drug/metabolite transporter (DMT)-like permease